MRTEYRCSVYKEMRLSLHLQTVVFHVLNLRAAISFQTGSQSGSQCDPSCETFAPCGNSCEPRCADLTIPSKRLCHDTCGSPACACKNGFYRNENGKCITKTECGILGASNSQQSSSCGINESIQICGRKCESTCESHVSKTCTKDCMQSSQPDCACSPGFARNGAGKCVLFHLCELPGQQRNNGNQQNCGGNGRCPGNNRGSSSDRTQNCRNGGSNNCNSNGGSGNGGFSNSDQQRNNGAQQNCGRNLFVPNTNCQNGGASYQPPFGQNARRQNTNCGGNVRCPGNNRGSSNARSQNCRNGGSNNCNTNGGSGNVGSFNSQGFGSQGCEGSNRGTGSCGGGGVGGWQKGGSNSRNGLGSNGCSNGGCSSGQSCDSTCEDLLFGSGFRRHKRCSGRGCGSGRAGTYKDAKGNCVQKEWCYLSAHEFCGKNEYYERCGDSCEPKCGDSESGLSVCPQKCSKPCCHCIPGTFRDPSGKCVEKRQCPGRTYCDLNEEYSKCGSRCAERCPTRRCGRGCEEGCFCKAGFRRKSGYCILETQCY